MIISAVLRRSLAFGPEHIEWLGRQVARVYPDVEFVPFSDVELRIPYRRLVEGLPAWWSKMEALRALKDDTVLMLDIDTALPRAIDLPVPAEGYAIMQSSPNNVDKLWGGLQFSSPEFRRLVTDHFFRDPQGLMVACGGCDQKHYQAHWMSRIKLLNALRPDAAVSYKLHVLQHGLRPENAFVMFHAQPRPWHTEHDWITPLFPPSE